jgi:DNA polymerase
LPPVIATLHPSAILRARTDEDRHAQMRVLVEDLKTVGRIAKG